MKYELVTDGESWAVKRTSGWFFKRVHFYSPGGYWWAAEDGGFRYCWLSKDAAEMWLMRLTA